VNLLVIPSAMGWIKSTWHLKAEEIGIKIVFVNLSNSGEPSVTFDSKYPVTWAPLSNWENMTVCSDFQREYFSEFSKKNGITHLNLVGVPDWTDIEYDNLTNETNFIAFFDIEPHVGNYGFSSINDSGYSDISNTIMFIEDIAKISAALGIRCILKSKRELFYGKRYKEYEIALSNLSKSNEYFSIISESVASRRIIGNSMATIHMPFTSTALIGNELNKPTCFYDPVGLISSNDPSAEKIEIIKKPQDLKKWLQNQVGLK
jgi:polysaccharide biosynthesis PFTS motif protein